MLLCWIHLEEARRLPLRILEPEGERAEELQQSVFEMRRLRIHKAGLSKLWNNKAKVLAMKNSGDKRFLKKAGFLEVRRGGNLKFDIPQLLRHAYF